MSLSPNEKYPGATEADPNYKDGKFKDNNPSTTNNGSPLKAIDRNEQLALQEAVMDAAGFEYNGTVDTPENSQMFSAYKAALSNGANLLSNHNFLIPSPDDSQPAPSATPTSYPPGYEIFSNVFANETSGILNLTYVDGHVTFSGGDFYMPVANTGGLERLTDFVASVADFDGKPRTRGVSFSLVGDEYRVTVGVDALEDESTNATPLGSVKFEQGSVATGHEAKSLFDIYGDPYITGVANVKAFGATGVGVDNDSLSVQEAIDTGLPVIFPEGKYIVDSLNNISQSLSSAKGAATLIFQGAGSCLNISGSNFKIENLTVIPTQDCHALISAVDIDNVEISSNTLDGLSFNVQSGVEVERATGSCKIYRNTITRTQRAIRSTIFFKRCSISDNHIYGNVDGIYFENYVHGAVITDNELHGNTGTALHFEGETRLRDGEPGAPPAQDPSSPLAARNCVTTGNHFDNNNRGLVGRWAEYLAVTGNHCKSSLVEGFFFDDVRFSTMTGNSLWANGTNSDPNYINIRIGANSSRNTIVGNSIAGQSGSLQFQGNIYDSVVFNEGALTTNRGNLQVTDSITFDNPDSPGTAGVFKRFSSGSGVGNSYYDLGTGSATNKTFTMNQNGSASFKHLVVGDMGAVPHTGTPDLTQLSTQCWYAYDSSGNLLGFIPIATAIL